jgi:hypothetical protein
LEVDVKYLLLTKYAQIEGVPPADEWDPADVEAHMAALNALNEQLTRTGELVRLTILAGRETAKIVTVDSAGTPEISDGPFAESKEFLAGYQLVDVVSEARALEIAALVSATPGPHGKPLGQPIEVRALMG